MKSEDIIKAIDQTLIEKKPKDEICIYFNKEYLTYSEVAIKLQKLNKLENIFKKYLNNEVL